VQIAFIYHRNSAQDFKPLCNAIACTMQRSKAVHEGLLLWLTEQQNQFIAAQQQQQSSANNTSTSSSSSGAGSSSSKAKKQPKKPKKGCWYEGFNPADLPLPDAVPLPHEPSPLAAAAREGIVIDAAAAAAGGITGPYLESSGGSKSPSTHHPFMSATPTKTKPAAATGASITAADSGSDDDSSATAARGGILTNRSATDPDTAADSSSPTAGSADTAGANDAISLAQQPRGDEVVRAATAVHSGSLKLGDKVAAACESSAAVDSASSSNDTAAAVSCGDAVEFDASKLIAHLKSLPFYKVKPPTVSSMHTLSYAMIVQCMQCRSTICSYNILD
jgi:hypothetical protein